MAEENPRLGRTGRRPHYRPHRDCPLDAVRLLQWLEQELVADAGGIVKFSASDVKRVRVLTHWLATNGFVKPETFTR